MKIVIPGGSGQVGTILARYLNAQKHEVVVLSRAPKPAAWRTLLWDGRTADPSWTGEIEGAQYEDITYEGYGPGGVAIIVDVLTDNRNRAVSEIRHAFSKNGGNLGESGSVSFMFAKKGLIIVEKSTASEDKLTEIVLDAGAEDLSDEGDTWEILCDPKEFEAVSAALKQAAITPEHAEVTMISSTYTKLEGSAASQMMRLLDVLEDLDDTQNVYSNFDMDEDTVA